MLGWRPAIALKEGLTKTIPYFEELLVARGTSPRRCGCEAEQTP